MILTYCKTKLWQLPSPSRDYQLISWFPRTLVLDFVRMLSRERPSHLSQSTFSFCAVFLSPPVSSADSTGSLDCSASCRRPRAIFATGVWAYTCFWRKDSKLRTCKVKQNVHVKNPFGDVCYWWKFFFRVSPGDRRLWKVISVEFSHRESNITLSKSKLDASLLEGLGKLFQLLEIRRFLGWRF